MKIQKKLYRRKIKNEGVSYIYKNIIFLSLFLRHNIICSSHLKLFLFQLGKNLNILASFFMILSMSIMGISTIIRLLIDSLCLILKFYRV